jgi:hypothetical protein
MLNEGKVLGFQSSGGISWTLTVLLLCNGISVAQRLKLEDLG